MRDLSLTLGVLARIENDTYEIIAVQSNSGAYVRGEKYALGNSYSREVFEQQQTIAVTSQTASSPVSLITTRMLHRCADPAARQTLGLHGFQQHGAAG
jgi:hypothetical protein